MSKRSRRGDWASIGIRIFIPDHKIEKPQRRYHYVPVQGYSASLAVFSGDPANDLSAKCIGWIDTRTLGYENAKEWILATGWRGY